MRREVLAVRVCRMRLRLQQDDWDFRGLHDSCRVGQLQQEGERRLSVILRKISADGINTYVRIMAGHTYVLFSFSKALETLA